MAELNSIIEHVESVVHTSLTPHRLSSVGGGCINTAYHLQSENQAFFIKLNRPSLAAMFEAEAQGLQEIAATETVRVPEPICFGTADGYSYLVLEYIQLGSLRGRASATLGKQLARMHKVEQPYFGWSIDNTIGSTAQLNNRHDDWLSFWQQQRLEQQLAFAAQKGFGGHLQNRGEKLLADLPALLADHHPHPSLLHGDLWGGNAAADDKANPVIFDPACYYGDREADLAMTELFGGFGSDFFSAYQAEYSVDAGYQRRKTLYNLYHILNHVNLFGAGYLGQAEGMIDRLLAEV